MINKQLVNAARAAVIVACAMTSVRAADMTVESARTMMAKAVKAVYDLELTPPAVNVDPGPEFSRTNMTFAMNGGMALTPGGRLWSVWHAGGDGPKAHVVGTWSDDDGRTWRDTRIALCTPKPLFVSAAGCNWFDDDRMLIRLSCIVANVWMAPDGTLRLYALVAVNGFDGRGVLYEYVCRNPDAEKPSWSAGRQIGWGGAHNKPQVLADGTWIIPNDFEAMMGENFPELNPLRGCGLLASSDGGRTWTRRGYVKPKGTNHYAEHQVVEFADRSLLMYLRTGLGLMESRSRDGGRTWTQPEPPKALRQIIARFVLQRLPSGHLLFVKNGNGPMVEPDGDWWGKRRELTAFVSADGGATWKGGLVLDPRARVAYPDAFVSTNGFVYVSYDHDRETGCAEILFAKITEADVLAGHLVTAGSSLRNVVFSSKRDETAVLQAKIDAAFRAGGGEVRIPAGEHRVGGLRLRSKVTLHLEAGAVLRGSRDETAYDRVLERDRLEPIDPKLLTWKPEYAKLNPVDRWNNAVIRLYRADDAAIVGEPGSEIDGDNASYADGEEGFRGPHGICAIECNRLRLEGYAVRHAGNWAHRLQTCPGLRMKGVTVLGGHDGVHVRGSDNIEIADCVFKTGDDAIAGFDNCGVRVTNCTLNSACSSFRLAGTDVVIDGCTAQGPAEFPHRLSLSKRHQRLGLLAAPGEGRRNTLNFLLFFGTKLQPPRRAPGRIVVRNCRISGVDRFFNYNNSGKDPWQDGPGLTDVTFENCTAEGLSRPSLACAPEGQPVSVTFKGCRLCSTGKIEPPLHTRNARVTCPPETFFSGLK